MDEISKEILTTGVEVVVGKLYDDIVHPTAYIIGQRLKGAIRRLSMKEETIVEAAQIIEPIMRDVPPEKFVEPEPYIVGSAMLAMTFTLDCEELRNLYANLLASSMNSDIKDNVHPAFTEIIKQLSPDEARIMEYISNVGLIPFVHIHTRIGEKSYRMEYQYITNIPERVNIQNQKKIPEYIENLV